MEDWQEWQIRADQIAADLGTELDALEATYFADENKDFDYRGFWPRFRDLKERVRTAPAIRLEAKLDLERRLRALGSRAYKAQESVYARSGERKAALLERIAGLRSRAEQEGEPRALRSLRREFDQLRGEFDSGNALVPPDRQAVWDAWREANQFAWQRLVDRWGANETELREVLAAGQGAVERGNANAARQAVARFFEALRTREAKQDAVNQMKAEAEQIRRAAEELEERAAGQRATAPSVPAVPAVDSWRADLERNRTLASRLSEEVAELERQVQESGSILEQAMLRGTLVEKKRKLTELERANRGLEQRIEQTEESPLIPSA